MIETGEVLSYDATSKQFIPVDESAPPVEPVV